ncbi:LytR C-terminal domain-containing protein [Naasia lichenicola]|uniref:LytR family transcriptional regulator n=1 Tax=Naasia lichenicola TaxID=2565933 RepID=A0A4S4FJ20_9MICO|nr:LytR C-terminal domain-containing protein [Naasia lichenicola]THG29842.1 LytR family transcriptional regulator [Naasia lichenicola]
MPAFPSDRFDIHPASVGRVGAHRGAQPKNRGFVTFAWAALATGILVGLGVVWILVINDRVSFDSPFGGTGTGTVAESTTAAPTVAPTIDPSASIIILNGTETDGLAGQVGNTLSAAGWTVGSTGTNATPDVTTTTIYYDNPAQEGAAKGLSEALGGAPIELSQAFYVEGLNRIGILIGADYVPAG